MVVEVERSDVRDENRNYYTVTQPGIDVKERLGRDKYLWKKFMPGQVKIKCEAWCKDGKLVIGKVIND